jgi:hypothetical protein
MNQMETRITYGVEWRTTSNNELHPFAEWLTDYSSALKVYLDCMTNPQCVSACIVERTEQFKIVKSGNRT